MRYRMILLLTLVMITVGFMAFLVNNSGSKKICEQVPCCKKAAPVQNSGGGGPEPETDNGSFHHLIVSTIK